jgi:putative transcriptional regulator
VGAHRYLRGTTLRNRLRALREARGWTQGALADRLDVSRQTVNALETGRYDPSLPLAFRIARLFDEPIEAIFEPDDATADMQRP